MTRNLIYLFLEKQISLFTFTEGMSNFLEATSYHTIKYNY